MGENWNTWFSCVRKEEKRERWFACANCLFPKRNDFIEMNRFSTAHRNHSEMVWVMARAMIVIAPERRLVNLVFRWIAFWLLVMTAQRSICSKRFSKAIYFGHNKHTSDWATRHTTKSTEFKESKRISAFWSDGRKTLELKWWPNLVWFSHWSNSKEKDGFSRFFFVYIFSVSSNQLAASEIETWKRQEKTICMRAAWMSTEMDNKSKWK